MDVAGIIALVQVVVQSLPGAITTAEQLYDLGAKFWAVQNGAAPTVDEQTALESAIDADVAQALAPLPPQ